MNSDDPQGGGKSMREVSARKISTADDFEHAVQETVSVALEAPTTIDVQGVESYTLLCTPDDNRALAAGFLLSEGIIDGLEDVLVLRECEDDSSVIRARLKQTIPRIDDAGRNMLIVSSCGLCGTEGLDERLRSLPAVGRTLRIHNRDLRTVGQRLRNHQPLFRACGSTHAACIFTAGGEITSSAEDTGRHNALDKAIGRALLANRPPRGCGALLSGRVSLEMVTKCARAGIELINAVSAPTSLAIEVAESCGITLCAFVRENRATLFSHPERVTFRAGGED
jgi:FdhD protein